MDCPQCGQPVEPGAAYCGNCGLQLPGSGTPPQAVPVFVAPPPLSLASPLPATQPGVSPVAAPIPAYALARPQGRNHVKVIIALVCGILGIVGALFIPLIGIVLGITGIVLATLATSASGRALKITGLIVSIGALLASLGVWVYVANENPRLHPAAAQKAAAVQSSGSATTAVALTTPCYSLRFPVELNIDNATKSCDMDAYNGKALTSSTNVYKVLTSMDTNITAASFPTIAKKAIQTDVSENLPGYAVSSEGAGMFAGSQAYFVNATNSSSGIAVEEAAVLHSSAIGPGLFVLIHITFGTSTNLGVLESNWQWK